MADNDNPKVGSKQSVGPQRLTVRFNPPFFTNITYPNGSLPPIREAQALWHYYGCAVNALGKIGNVQLIEGEPDYDPDFCRLFRASATAYGVEPNEMGKYWEYIDREIGRQNDDRSKLFMPTLTNLPEDIKFRNLPKRVMQ